MISGSDIRKRNTNFRQRDPRRVTYQNHLDPLKEDHPLPRMASRRQIRHPGTVSKSYHPRLLSPPVWNRHHPLLLAS